MVSGELSIEIGKLKAELDKARQELRKYKGDAEREGKGMGTAFFGGMGGAAKEQFGNLIGVLGFGAGVAGFVGGVKDVLNTYNNIADTALKLNESTEVVQRVGQVARLSGSSLEGVSNSMLKLEKALGEVENAAARDALERYGVTAEGLMRLPLDEKLLVLSEAFQKARVEGTGYNDLMTLLGKSAGELIPLLSQTGETLREAFAGVAVINDQDVKQLADMNTQLDQMVAFGRALIAMRLKDHLNWGKFIKDVVTVGYDQALDNVGERTMENQRAQKARTDAREEQAINTQRMQDEAAAAAAAKKQEEAKKRVLEIEKQIVRAEQDALPDEDKIEMLKTQLEEFFNSLPGDFVAEYGASIEGMRQLAEEMKDAGRFDIAEGILKQVREAQEIMDRIAETQKRMDDQAKKSADDRAKSLERATDLELDFMPHAQKLEAIKAELRKAFDETATARGDMEALKEKDPAAYNKALQNLKEGASLSGGGMAQKVGSVADAINIFTGRGANQLGEQQVDLLTQARDLLKDIAKNLPGKDGPQEIKVPVFAYP